MATKQPTYRVIAPGIDCVRRGPNDEIMPNLTVARPGNARRGQYTDSDEAPTLVTFDEFCQVDIDMLLASGAIVPYTKPAKAADPEPPAARKEDTRGQVAS